MKRLVLLAGIIAWPALAEEPPGSIALSPQEAQQVINALAPPAMQMLIGKLQAAQAASQQDQRAAQAEAMAKADALHKVQQDAADKAAKEMGLKK